MRVCLLQSPQAEGQVQCGYQNKCWGLLQKMRGLKRLRSGSIIGYTTTWHADASDALTPTESMFRLSSRVV